MKLMYLNKILLLILILSLSSCQSEYTKVVKKELASGVKNDTIFYGLQFGQSKPSFFKTCWELNRKKLISHGSDNNYVQKLLIPQDSSDTTREIKMLFYPMFDENDIIIAMDIKFSYEAWAPWNKDLESNKLLPNVQDTLSKWYPGNPFIKLKNNIFVKVDGNRQIQLNIESDRDVAVKIEDLSYKYNKVK